MHEYPTYPYQVYSNLVRLNPGRELASVVLPNESRVRFFDWQVVEQPLPPAPEGSAFASDLDWISATKGCGVILEAGFAGNVIFKVDGDGVNQYQSRTFTPGFAPESVNVDLTGVQYVDLIVEAPGSINGAHGVWGNAKFHC